MSKNNTTYKQTPIGLIPSDWEVKRLEDVVTLINGKSYSQDELLENGKYRVLRVGNLFSNNNWYYSNLELEDDKYVENGDLMYAWSASFGPRFWKEEKIIYHYHIWKVLISDRTTKDFIYQLLEFDKELILRKTQGGTMVHITKGDMENRKLPIPPLPEQQKIASILSTWDTAIDNCKAIIEKLKDRNKGLAQQLLTGKIRVKGFEKTKWKLTPLNECLAYTPREVPKPTGNYLALGLRSHGKGIFHKHDIDPEDVAMEFLYEVKENDLIVNITFAWEQALAIVSKKDEGGLVSHRFPTYTFKTETAIPEFFRHFIVQKYFKFLMELISPGGAGRNRVMSKTDFLKLDVKLPDAKEQKVIANILDAASVEFNQYQQKLQKLQLQKKGLMQQLLTGKIRVNV